MDNLSDGGPTGAQPESIVRFNLAPVGFVHETWQAEDLSGAELLGALSQYPVARSRISDHLLKAHNIEGSFFCDFSETRSRIVLLPHKQLESLFLYVGATLRHTEFVNELSGRRVAALRQSLGASLVDYAVKRVAFSGEIPEFRYEPEADIPPRLRLIQIGAVYTVSPRASAVPAYVRRLALKLPKPISHGLICDAPHKAAEPDNKTLPLVAQRVVREFLPKWQNMFV